MSVYSALETVRGWRSEHEFRQTDHSLREVTVANIQPTMLFVDFDLLLLHSHYNDRKLWPIRIVDPDIIVQINHVVSISVMLQSRLSHDRWSNNIDKFIEHIVSFNAPNPCFRSVFLTISGWRPFPGFQWSPWWLYAKNVSQIWPSLFFLIVVIPLPDCTCR